MSLLINVLQMKLTCKINTTSKYINEKKATDKC